MEKSFNEKSNGTFLPRTKGAKFNKSELSFPFSYLIISFKYKTLGSVKTYFQIGKKQS